MNDYNQLPGLLSALYGPPKSGLGILSQQPQMLPPIPQHQQGALGILQQSPVSTLDQLRRLHRLLRPDVAKPYIVPSYGGFVRG